MLLLLRFLEDDSSDSCRALGFRGYSDSERMAILRYGLK